MPMFLLIFWRNFHISSFLQDIRSSLRDPIPWQLAVPKINILSYKYVR